MKPSRYVVPNSRLSKKDGRARVDLSAAWAPRGPHPHLLAAWGCSAPRQGSGPQAAGDGGGGAAKHGDEGRGARGEGVSSGEAEAKTASEESWGPYNLSPRLTQPRAEPRAGRDHIQAPWSGRG